jgi:coenzyme F420 hydrogenase subunit beta
MKNIPHNSIKIITENDLCISCGACSHICPYKNIQIRLNHHHGKWEPIIPKIDICDNRCNGKELCLSVCPSYNVNYIDLAESDKNHLLGKIERVYTGFSKNDAIRFSSSSGGFIPELCTMLLDSRQIDGIISITHDHGLEYTPKIIHDVTSMPCSIYHNINFENAIELLKKAEGKYLLIALPCQITSIELFTNKKKHRHLKEKIYAKVALICGYLLDRTCVQATAYYNRFDVKEIAYRGDGRDLLIKMKNEHKKLEYDTFYPKTLTEVINNRMMFDNFTPQLGCLYCVDHLGYCADLVVGDAWLQKYTDDKIGTNIIISRTQNAENLIRQMTSFHFIEASYEDIIEAQGVHYALGAVGEGLKEVKGHSFSPDKLRTKNSTDIMKYHFRLKDIIKMKVIKRLIQKNHFRLAKSIYMILEVKYILKYLFKRYPADGFLPPFDLLPLTKSEKDNEESNNSTLNK